MCWAPNWFTGGTLRLREITVKMLEIRGAEVRQKEHQVSAAIPFSGTAAPPSEKSVSGRTADVPR